MARRPSAALVITVVSIAALRLTACGGKSGRDTGSGASGAAGSSGSGIGGGSGDATGGGSQSGSTQGGTGDRVAGAAGMARGGSVGIAGTPSSGTAGSGTTPGPGCDYDGTHYESGESWPVGCNRCFCEEGQVACTTRICNPGSGGLDGGASAGTGGDRGGGGEPSVEPTCGLDIGSLCLVGTPTTGGHELSAGMPLLLSMRPAGCFSSSCTKLVDSSCNYLSSGSEIYISGFFCVASEGDACTDDCGGAPESTCDSGFTLTAGEYTVSVSGNAGALLSKLTFTVPGVVAERDRCTHSL